MNLFAQVAVEHVLNTLPEGLLLAACAWMLVRLIPRQNSGTRFAVWMVALAGVVALPFLAAMRTGASSLLPQTHPELTLSPFWATAFWLLWLPIALLALGRILAGLWQVRRIRRSCRPIAPSELDPALRELFTDQKRPVRLLVSATARVPAAMGFRHPVVVLPAWALRDLPPARLRPILIHELAHIRRRDDWSNLAQKIARALFFFHPAVWWIDARLSLEREMACDEAVVAATGNPRAYAGCLIDLLERGCARRGWSMAQAAVTHARDASVRIARILHLGRPASTRVGRRALALAAAVSLACAAVVLCVPGFVGFAPVHSQMTASIPEEGGLAENLRVPASAVVPAMYRPAHTAGALVRSGADHLKPMHRRALLHEAPILPPQTRLAVVRRKRQEQVPVVMTSLNDGQRVQTPAASAYLVIRSTAVQFAPAAAAVERTGRMEVEGSVVQVVQTFQIVQRDGSGIQVRVFRLVMRLPAATEGITSQSI